MWLTTSPMAELHAFPLLYYMKGKSPCPPYHPVLSKKFICIHGSTLVVWGILPHICDRDCSSVTACRPLNPPFIPHSLVPEVSLPAFTTGEISTSQPDRHRLCLPLLQHTLGFGLMKLQILRDLVSFLASLMLCNLVTSHSSFVQLLHRSSPAHLLQARSPPPWLQSQWEAGGISYKLLYLLACRNHD